MRYQYTRKSEGPDTRARTSDTDEDTMIYLKQRGDLLSAT